MAEQKTQQQDDDVVGKAYDGRLMRRLMTYLRPYKLQAGISLAAILLKAGSDVLGPYLTKVAVDRYMTARPAPHQAALTRWLNPNPMVGVTQIACLYLATLVLSYLLEFVQTYLMQWTGQKVMFDMRSQIFRHIQRMHVSFFDRHPVGRLVTRLTSDVDALNEMFTSGVFAIFEDVFVLALIVIIMLRMNWWLALIAFAVLPLILAVTRVFRKHVRDSYRRIRSAIARINASTQEHVSGMSVVQLFNREQRSYEEFEAVNKQHMVAFKDAIMAYALYYPAVELLSSVAIALVIWLGGNGVLRNAVSIGVLVAFIQYSQRFFRPIMDLSEKYNILQAAMAASERVFKLLDTTPELQSPVMPRTCDGSGSIEFRHVWFTYQTLDAEQLALIQQAQNAEQIAAASPDVEWILKDVSFAIEPDQTAAIVGHTGAGKTTIIQLLLRFYDIQRGEILLDGVDIREINLQDLRRMFGIVLQDPFLFTGTLESNVRLGSENISRGATESALREVGLGPFLDSQPKGLDTPVTERGGTLSVGQRQLVSFARALAHNPKFLILDEATSSVDTKTELLIRDALNRLLQGRTAMVIAHRLSTIQHAHRILVFHKGRLREQGSHQQLLMLRGIYYRLYQLQYKEQELQIPTSGAEASGFAQPVPAPQPAND